MLVAYAVVHGDPPDVYMAKEALLEERWGDAVYQWMEATRNVVDVYPAEDVWTEAQLDAERASLEFRMSPLFEEP